MTNDYPQQSLDIILYTMLSTNVCEIDMNQIPLLPVLAITNTYNIAHIFFPCYQGVNPSIKIRNLLQQVEVFHAKVDSI